MNLYGVTYSDISANVHNLSITTASSPDIDAVTDMISYYAAEIAREQAVVGITSTDISSGSDEYNYAKRALISAVSGEVLVSRNRGNADSGKFYTELYQRYIATLRKRPQVQSNTDDGPNLVREIDNASNPNKRKFNDSLSGILVKGGL